jgi:hypothetical protein
LERRADIATRLTEIIRLSEQCCRQSSGTVTCLFSAMGPNGSSPGAIKLKL